MVTERHDNRVRTTAHKSYALKTQGAEARDREQEQLDFAKEASVRKCAKGKNVICDEATLTRYVYIGDGAQEPYGELIAMLSRIYEYGTVKVQPTFVRSVRSCVVRGEIMQVAIPEHLQAVDGFEATLLQRFRTALETLTHANGAEVMTVILKRKALLTCCWYTMS